MSVTANAIEVKISADASGFRRGAEEAKAGIDRLTDKLREHKAEQIQEARTTRFYANEIANLGVVSHGTSKALGELLAGAATGTGFGLAVGAVKALVEVIRESGEESKRQSEALKENYKGAAETVSEALKKVRESFAPPKSLTQAAWETAAKAVHKEIKEVQKEIDKLVAKGPGVKDFMSFLFHSDEGAGNKHELPIEARVAELQKVIDAKQAGIESQRPAKQTTRDAEARAARLKILENERNDSIQRRTEMLAAENVVSTEIWSRATEQMHVDAEALRLKKEQAQADAQAVLDAERLVSPLVSVAEFERIAAEQAAVLAEEMRIQEAEAKKLQHELGQAAKELGDAMGQNLADVLKGSKSIDDALQGVLATLIKVATQMALMAALSAGGPLGVLGGIAIGTIGGALGSLFGSGLTSGGGTTNNHFTINGSGLSSRQMETVVVNALRSAQRRGRF